MGSEHNPAMVRTKGQDKAGYHNLPIWQFRLKYWNEKGTRSCHELMLASMGMPKAILYYTCVI